MRQFDSRDVGMLLLVVACAFVAWFAIDARASGSKALDRALTAEAALPMVVAARDSAAHRADSVTVEALRTDSVVAALVATADSVADQADMVLPAQMDTIRLLVKDTVALRLLDQRDSLFAGVIAAKDQAIDSLTSWGLAWRTSSFVKDTVIMGWAKSDSLHVVVNQALHAHIRGQVKRKWIERSVQAALLACVVLCS